MRQDKQKIEWLDSDLFLPFVNVNHKMFLRHGGMSSSPFDSLNVSNSVGDHPNAVKTNRERIKTVMEVDHLAFLHQVHGTKMIKMTLENCDRSSEGDAFFTREKGIGLVIAHADCQAACFYDPHTELIAAVHAGWKGLVKNIYGKTVKYLMENEGVNPGDLRVCISPSLGPEAAEFRNFKREIPENLWGYQKTPFYFDLWDIAKSQLIESGIDERHIDNKKICTFRENQDYFSYRKENKTGRVATVIALK